VRVSARVRPCPPVCAPRALARATCPPLRLRPSARLCAPLRASAPRPRPRLCASPSPALRARARATRSGDTRASRNLETRARYAIWNHAREAAERRLEPIRGVGCGLPPPARTSRCVGRCAPLRAAVPLCRTRLAAYRPPRPPRPRTRTRTRTHLRAPTCAHPPARVHTRTRIRAYFFFLMPPINAVLFKRLPLV
jgi:hypothetical protein